MECGQDELHGSATRGLGSGQRAGRRNWRGGAFRARKRGDGSRQACARQHRRSKDERGGRAHEENFSRRLGAGSFGASGVLLLFGRGDGFANFAPALGRKRFFARLE